MKRMLLISLLVLMTGGCGINSPTENLKFPTLIPRHVEKNLQGKSKEDVRKHVKELRNYQRSLENYIEAIHEDVLKEKYLSARERRSYCLGRFPETFSLPVSPDIKDDGTFSDDYIIVTLVDYIRRIKLNVARYNNQLEQRLVDYKNKCVL